MTASPIPDISLTSFLQYAAAQTSLTRINKVKQIKKMYEAKYRQGADSYRRLRKHIAIARGAGLDVDRTLEECPEKDKESYILLTKHYNKLFSTIGGECVGARKTLWEKGELRVKVNPELAFRKDGVTKYYKLHLTKAELRKRSADVIFQMMVEALAEDGSETAAIADLRAGRILEVPATVPNPSMSLALQVDAEMFVKFWRAV